MEIKANQKVKGIDIITEFANSLPAFPGVYKMIGARGLLYIGKAKNLKVRVKSYAKLQDQSPKNLVMIQSVLRVEYEVVETEADALILESSLIKKHQPPFNIMLKDDKSKPYLVVSRSHAFPAIQKIRGKPNKKDEFFGPFADKQAMEYIMNLTCKTFKIRTCEDSKFKSVKRPCLEYQIKRCSAPCVNYISESAYLEDVKNANSFLSGHTREIEKQLKAEMDDASEKEEFERALEIRNKLFNLQKLSKTGRIDFRRYDDTDAVLISEKEGQFGIEVFTVRSGFSYGGSVYFPSKTADESAQDILSLFLISHYSDRNIPAEILLNIKLSEGSQVKNALSKLAGFVIKLSTPLRGIKKDLVDFAKCNLEEKLLKRTIETGKIYQNLTELKQLLGLASLPKRIEVYDNSHTNGAFFMGGMIVAGPDGFVKKEYRKFNMKFSETIKGDDYGMLREVLKRRFLNEKMKQNLPDLIIIDGGRGQYSSALSVFLELEINIPFICIAKGANRNAGNETFWFNGQSFRLPEKTPLLYYLENLRDEAHRFAITSMRNRRDKI